MSERERGRDVIGRGATEEREWPPALLLSGRSCEAMVTEDGSTPLQRVAKEKGF
jgi:hypothetical protein